METLKAKRNRRIRRHARVRSIVSGTAVRPRLSVSRSLQSVFLQLIDDEAQKTIFSVASKGLKAGKDNTYKGKTALAYEAGLALAKKALEKKIETVCFDRGGYAYHGRVKAVAEGARAGGLKF